MTGGELNDAMRIRGISCRDLAEKTGLPVQKIRNWKKNGGIPHDADMKIRKALGTSMRQDGCLMYTVKTSAGCRFGIRGARK